MTPEFRTQLRTKLAPLLRAEGFSGSGVTFRRVRGEVIQLLHVQGSRYGDSCCVELCVHLTFLPTKLNHPADPKNIRFADCEFRRRLAPEGESDYWWAYGSNEVEAAGSVARLVDSVQHSALPHFDRFGNFPGWFEGITPQVIASDSYGDFGVLPGDLTVARAALAMARIAAHLGRPEHAQEFAEVGLASLSGRSGVAIASSLAALAGRS